VRENSKIKCPCYIYLLNKSLLLYIYKSMIYHIVISTDEDGVFTGSVKELPGCISQGKNREELIYNIEEAVELYLESYEKHNETYLLNNE